jgi:DNA-binding response OmpR family regulator
MSWRILVINDDQSILDLFPLILEAEGHEVLLSHAACEEASQIEQQHPQLPMIYKPFDLDELL